MLRAQLPALSHWFGLRPVDLDDMTGDEINEYLKALTEIDKKLDEQDAALKQRR